MSDAMITIVSSLGYQLDCYVIRNFKFFNEQLNLMEYINFK